jgi:TP901 family phage tail tape measure protein
MARGFRIASAFVEISAKTDKQQMRKTADRVGRQGGAAYSSGFGAAAGAGMKGASERAHRPVQESTGKFSKSGRASGSAFSSGFGTAAGAGMGGAFSKATDAPMRDTSGRFTAAGKEGGAGFTKGARMGLGGFAGAFTPVTAAVGVVTGLLGGAVLGAAGDFESAMNGVRAVTGATGRDFKELEGLAQELGSTTQFSATQSANAMEYLGMAGWDTTQIMDGLPDVLNLAAAGGIDLGQAADIASNAMSAFGADATESGRFADALAFAAANANVNVEGLGMSLSRSAGAANSAGWSIEQTTGALGLFGNVGVSAEEAGTGLAAMLGEVMDESSTAAEVFNRFGVEVQNSDGSVRDLADILIDAKEAGMGFNDSTEAFGSDHGRKFASALGLSVDELEKSKFAADDAADSANAMGETRMEGLQGALTTIKSAMEGLAIEAANLGILDFATGLAERFGSAIQSLTGWLSENSERIRPIAQAIGVFAGAVAGVLGVLIAVKLAVAAFGAVLAVVASPVLLVVGAIGLLAVGLWLAWKNSETFRNGVLNAWGAIKDAWSRLWDGALKPGLDALVQAFKDNWPAIKDMALEAFQAIMAKVEEIRPKVMKIIGQIAEFWEAHGGKIIEVAKIIFGLVVDRVKSAFTLIITVIKGAWQIVSGIFSGALDVIGGIFDVFAGLFTGDWARLWDGVKSIFSGLWTAVKGIFQGAVTIIGGIVVALVDMVKGPFLALWNWLVGNSLVPDLVNAVRDWFMKMRDWVSNTVKALVSRVVAFFTNLRDRGAAIVAALRDWVVARVSQLRDRFIAVHVAMRDRALAMLSSLRDRARAIADNIRDWITTRVRTLRDNVVGAFNTLKDKAISAFTKAKDGIKTAWDKLKQVAKSPVKFAIETVYNKGIVPLWNKIAAKVSGVSELREMSLPRGFERGGMVDMRAGGVQPGYSAKDNRLAMFRDGEGVLVPEAVSSLGPGFVHAANAMKGRAGELLAGLPGFQFGGIIGEFGSAMSGFFKNGFMKAVRAVTTPIVNSIKDEFGTSGFKGLPTKIFQFLVGKLHSFLTPFSSDLEGGDGQGVVDEARKHVGKSGRPNEFMTPYMGGSWPWCGAFAGQMFERSGAGKAISSVQWKPAVRSWRSLPKTSDPRPGDVALYRGDDGHINIVEDPASRKTIGGNESNAVRRQTGYMNSASSVRRPAFAGGGLVEARAFWDQDRRETPAWMTPLRDKVMREALDSMPATHDSGGVVLDRHAGVNRKGEAELMVTAARLDRWASTGGGSTFTGDIHVHLSAKDLKEMQDIRDFFARVQSTARQHGSRKRVGAPR